MSPYFQQAALDYHQLDMRYEALETSPEKLEATVAAIRQEQNLGANVTVPYKEAFLPLLHEVDADKSKGYNVTTRQRSSGVEQRTHKPLVAGSNPAAATSFYVIINNLRC